MTEHSLLEIGFRPLLDAAPDATVVVARHGSVVALNRDVESLFGWPEAELLGQPMNRLIPARFHRVLEHMLELPINHESPGTRPKGVRVSLFARRRDGSELPVEINRSPLGPGPDALALVTIRDLTE